MSDFGNINEFRKTTQLRKINEDPTYLSFFFLFNFNDNEHSPLLSGAAEDYLRNVVRDPQRADLLSRFKKLLRKVNRELPWFWQSVSGLDATKQYGDMEEPWRGAEKPKLEIECLENVELTSFALIDLYKRAVYDFNRWVKVIPTNLCEFEMTVYVTEVRKIQQSHKDGLINSKRKNTSNTEIKNKKDNNSKSRKTPDTIESNNTLSTDAKPIIVTKLGYCHFDIESPSDLFADLNKSPDMATSKINIFWQTSEQTKEIYGKNLNANQDDSLVLEKESKNQEVDNNPFSVENKAEDIGNNLKDRAEGSVENITNRFDEIPGRNSGLENVHGSLLTGQLGQLADSVGESITGRLLLENVHGLNTGSNIQDAINTGSLNAIFNSASQLFNNNSNGESERGTISPKRAYEDVIQGPEGPIKTKVYEDATDSSPDGNINQNVHE